MQCLFNDKKTHILRFDKNEEVIGELINYCKKAGISSGFFTGLGASQKLTLSYYNLEKKNYQDKTYTVDLEILGITGNIAQMNEEHVVHAHGSFAADDYVAVGGHIKLLIVSATCELHLTVLEKKLTRGFDEKTGLNLLRK